MKNAAIALMMLMFFNFSSAQEVKSFQDDETVAATVSSSTLDLRLRPAGYQVRFKGPSKQVDARSEWMVVNPLHDPLSYNAMIAIITDWGTTLDIAKRRNEGWYEANPITAKIIGKHPEVSRVHQYFIAVAAIHLLSRSVLPEWMSNITLAYAVIEHGRAGWKNHRLGLNMNF